MVIIFPDSLPQLGAKSPCVYQSANRGTVMTGAKDEHSIKSQKVHVGMRSGLVWWFVHVQPGNQGLRPSPQVFKPNYDLFLTLMGSCDAFLFGECNYSVNFYSLLLTRKGYDDDWK